MVNMQKNLTSVAILFFVFALTVVMCGKVSIKKRSVIAMDGGGGGSRDSEDLQKSRPIKRTFCNAFTGCQGKRSDGPPVKDYDYEQRERESVRDALEGNSKMDDVTRDILAEARLWEAFQTRNSRLYPMMRRQGFFGREKRSASISSEKSLE